MVGSFSAASAKPINPRGSATTAGKIIRNSTRLLTKTFYQPLAATSGVSDWAMSDSITALSGARKMC